MEFSRKTDYALRAMVELAGGKEQPISAFNLAKTTQAPYAFVTKILGELAAHKLVSIFRGREGGVKLAVDPNKTTALDVIVAINGPIVLNRCVEDPATCSRSSVCPVHNMWVVAQKRLESSLKIPLKTLAETQNIQLLRSMDG